MGRIALAGVVVGLKIEVSESLLGSVGWGYLRQTFCLNVVVGDVCCFDEGSSDLDYCLECRWGDSYDSDLKNSKVLTSQENMVVYIPQFTSVRASTKRLLPKTQK